MAWIKDDELIARLGGKRGDHFIANAVDNYSFYSDMSVFHGSTGVLIKEDAYTIAASYQEAGLNTMLYLESKGMTGATSIAVSISRDCNAFRPSVRSNWAGHLSVTPIQITFAGQYGGPFVPTSASAFSVGNSGPYPFDWQVADAVPIWLTITSATGGASTEATGMTCSINDAANTLEPGYYYASLTFENTFTGIGTTGRTIELIISDTHAET